MVAFDSTILSIVAELAIPMTQQSLELAEADEGEADAESDSAEAE